MQSLRIQLPSWTKWRRHLVPRSEIAEVPLLLSLREENRRHASSGGTTLRRRPEQGGHGYATRWEMKGRQPHLALSWGHLHHNAKQDRRVLSSMIRWERSPVLAYFPGSSIRYEIFQTLALKIGCFHGKRGKAAYLGPRKLLRRTGSSNVRKK